MSTSLTFYFFFYFLVSPEISNDDMCFNNVSNCLDLIIYLIGNTKKSLIYILFYIFEYISVYLSSLQSDMIF